MNESNHTPGPWKVDEHGVIGRVGARPYQDRVAGIMFSGDSKQTLANANLITAAPDLYNAVKVAVDYATAITKEYGGGRRDVRVLNVLHNALNKAEGK